MCLKRSSKACLLVLSLFVFAGCNSDDRDATQKLESYPAQGKILLNGKVPEYKISVYFHPTAEGDVKLGQTKAVSDKEGMVKTKLPAGSYKVTFALEAKKAFQTSGDSKPVDMFGKKYIDKGKSNFSVDIKEVSGEESNDFGEFQLEAEIDTERKDVRLPDFVTKRLK